MTNYHYQDKELWVENIPLSKIANEVKTPCYVYSKQALSNRWQAFDRAFASHPHTICYAVKANSSLAILHQLAKLGSGFDIVSGGELARVLKAGGSPEKIVFSGIGKTPDELSEALTHNIFCFNIESRSELIQLNKIAQHLNLRAKIALRINPDIDAQSHPYISTGLKENKFGIPATQAIELYQYANTLPHIEIRGIACHVGSQLLNLKPIIEATQFLLKLIDQLSALSISLTHIDVGGGLGVPYQNEKPPSVDEYAQAILNLCRDRDLNIIIEPGRAIVADAGILLTRVLYLKQTEYKHFCIVDCAMNDLIRPALYNAWHNILPTKQSSQKPQLFDVVGPICESGDFLGKDRELAVQEGDLLAIMTSGAYGFSNSSNYNTRMRPAEVLVFNNEYKVIRERETFTYLTSLEHF